LITIASADFVAAAVFVVVLALGPAAVFATIAAIVVVVVSFLAVCSDPKISYKLLF